MDTHAQAGKVATFRLTDTLDAAIQVFATRNYCSKDSAIRLLLHYGLLVTHELHLLEQKAVQRATRHMTKQPAHSGLDVYQEIPESGSGKRLKRRRK